MCAQFSDDQIGKRVVSQSGATMGEVSAVRNGDIYVTLDADADRDVVDQLNWDRVVNEETQHLHDRYVSNIRENTVRLNV